MSLLAGVRLESDPNQIVDKLEKTLFSDSLYAAPISLKVHISANALLFTYYIVIITFLYSFNFLHIFASFHERRHCFAVECTQFRCFFCIL